MCCFALSRKNIEWRNIRNTSKHLLLFLLYFSENRRTVLRISYVLELPFDWLKRGYFWWRLSVISLSCEDIGANDQYSKVEAYKVYCIGAIKCGLYWWCWDKALTHTILPTETKTWVIKCYSPFFDVLSPLISSRIGHMPAPKNIPLKFGQQCQKEKCNFCSQYLWLVQTIFSLLLDIKLRVVGNSITFVAKGAS